MVGDLAILALFVVREPPSALGCFSTVLSILFRQTVQLLLPSQSTSEPPSRKRPLSLVSSTSRDLILFHQEQQIESLQNELDHERASRALDAKKHLHAVQRLELPFKSATVTYKI